MPFLYKAPLTFRRWHLHRDMLTYVEARRRAMELAAELGCNVEEVRNPDLDPGWYIYSFEF